MTEQTNQFLFIEAFAYEKDKVLTEKQSEISLLKIQISALQQKVNQLLQENESLKGNSIPLKNVEQPIVILDDKFTMMQKNPKTKQSDDNVTT